MVANELTSNASLGNIDRVLTETATKDNATSKRNKVLNDRPASKQIAEIMVTNVTFMSHDFGRPLSWDSDIIEYNIKYANIKVTANIARRPDSKPSNIIQPPSEITVEVVRRSPKDDSGSMDKISAKTSFPLVIKGEKNGMYTYVNQSNRTISSKVLVSPSKDDRVSVASLKRKYDPKIGSAESDIYFRHKNNFVNRGAAIEDGADKDKERPPPRLLFLAGGVEVIELKVIANEHVIINQGQLTDKILIKSPADVFYYSGHGHSNLFSPQGVLKSVNPPLSPEEILRNWKINKSTVKALIIAGCSVVGIHKLKNKAEVAGRNRDGVGIRWARLLKSKGGPVENICGYWGSAPSDENGGNDIASRMGRKIAENVNS